MEPRNETEDRRNEAWARQLDRLHAELDPFEVTLDARPTGVPTERERVSRPTRTPWVEWAVAGLLSFGVGFGMMFAVMSHLRT